MGDQTCHFCGGRKVMVVDCDDGEQRDLPCVCQTAELRKVAVFARDVLYEIFMEHGWGKGPLDALNAVLDPKCTGV